MSHIRWQGGEPLSQRTGTTPPTLTNPRHKTNKQTNDQRGNAAAQIAEEPCQTQRRVLWTTASVTTSINSMLMLNVQPKQSTKLYSCGIKWKCIRFSLPTRNERLFNFMPQ